MKGRAVVLVPVKYAEMNKNWFDGFNSKIVVICSLRLSDSGVFAYLRENRSYVFL